MRDTDAHNLHNTGAVVVQPMRACILSADAPKDEGEFSDRVCCVLVIEPVHGLLQRHRRCTRVVYLILVIR